MFENKCDFDYPCGQEMYLLVKVNNHMKNMNPGIETLIDAFVKGTITEDGFFTLERLGSPE
jgi:hypothetical protein